MQGTIWSSRVNSFLALLFVGSFALGAGLIIWHTTFGENPVANIIASEIGAETAAAAQ